ncbi:MAG: helicase C-terminal domain-containing protein [Nanoarchaeota archaeon]|nr:helicase C-terminal domain-containing protein [Nanoarchaeota archaeon]
MWSLYNQHDELLKPLTFSNGKTQEHIVNEVVEAINQGHKIIFIKGTPGTGKSAIALNIANQIGRTSIVVPVKFLQKQYEHDYMQKLHLKRPTGEKLKIAMITGRNNHPCQYNKERTADYPLLPCIVEIKKENIDLLNQYIKENPNTNPEDFQELKDYTRTAVAAACPYWSPIVPEDYHAGLEGQRILYNAVNNNKLSIIQRQYGCTYYNQFHAYKTADVLIFNSKKYELENIMNRKPATQLEIIDEGDEFLDDMGTEKKINLNHLAGRIKIAINHEKREEEKEVLNEIYNLVQHLMKKNSGKEIMKLTENKGVELIDYFLRNPYLGEHEELAYYLEIAISFVDHKDTSYAMYSTNQKQEITFHIVNIDLQKKLKEYTDRNKTFIFMSGTLPSKQVLNDIYGIKDYIMIEAETKDQGTIKKVYTGKEKDFRWKNFNDGTVTRKGYLEALEACITVAQRPTLIHVNSFADLPTAEEHADLNLNIMPAERLQTLQDEQKTGELMQLFKQGKIDVLYSTKCTRGVDFPGDICNSIIFTKYPYPSMHDLFWQVLKKEQPKHYFAFYFDKATREYKQRIYRGLRSKEDTIQLLSPDLKVLH